MLENIAPALPYVLPFGLVIFTVHSVDKMKEKMDEGIKEVKEDIHGKTDKKHADTTFQRKDMCNQRYEELKDVLFEVRADVKHLISSK